jgi:hypothetical protein
MDQEQQPQALQPGCGVSSLIGTVVTNGALYAASQVFLKTTFCVRY